MLIPISGKIRELIKKIVYLYIRNIPININGTKFYVGYGDISYLPQLIWGRYETGTNEFLRDKIREGDTVVDVGAYFGYYTVLFAKLAGDTGKVICIEPEPGIYRLLKKNIAANHLKNVFQYPLAVSGGKGFSNLYISANSLDTTLARHKEADSKRLRVKTDTLDNILKYGNRIDFLKLDIQGYEMIALKGAAETLRKNKRIKMLVEFWPAGLTRARQNPLNLLKYIFGLGFKVEALNSKDRSVIKYKNLDDLLSLACKSAGGYVDLFCVR